MSRYKDPYAPVDVSKYLANTGAPAETADQKKKHDDADFWNFIGDIAPAAGTAVGGIAGGILGSVIPGAGTIAGAGAGATLGGALGSAVGAGSHSHADDDMSGREDQLQGEQDKQMRKDALLQTLMGLRR